MPRPATRFLLTLALLSAGEPTLAQEGAAPRLVLEGLDGRSERLPLEGLTLRDPRERGAWTIRTEGFPAPTAQPSTGVRVQLALRGGEELRGRVLSGQGEVLTIELLGGVRLPVGIERIRSIVLPEHLSGRELTPLTAPPEGDRLYRRTPNALDAVDGTLDTFTAEGVRFESREVGLKTFAWIEVAALFIELLDDQPPATTGDGARVPLVVDLADQSRVRGRLDELTPEHCRVTVGGVALALPWEVVAELTVADGRLVFLSDLEATHEEGRGIPFDDDLGMSWPHKMDRNVHDDPLRSGGRFWRRGIGMHAPSRLYFDLPGDFDELVGRVAMDDSVLVNRDWARGSVIFRLHLDGALAWESGLVRGGDSPLDLPRLAVSGKRELMLEVDPAGDFAGDRANWLRMTLVRSEP